MKLPKNRTVVASDVSDRDGIGVEIYRNDELVVELFRDDSVKTRTITVFKKDISLELMEESGADTVVSVIELPHHFSPYTIMRLRDGCLQDFWQESLSFDHFRRQNLPVLYARNGPAILASRVTVLFESQSFYGGHVVPYTMTQEESVDIDKEYDVRLAEWLIAQRRASN